MAELKLTFPQIRALRTVNEAGTLAHNMVTHGGRVRLGRVHTLVMKRLAKDGFVRRGSVGWGITPSGKKALKVSLAQPPRLR